MNATIVSVGPRVETHTASPASVTVSVVSHGQRELVLRLLEQIAQAHDGVVRQVVLTHNLAEPAVPAPPQGWPFVLTERVNLKPMGFGANHNQAFAHCDTEFFCVLNPDVTFVGEGLWRRVVLAAQRPGTGCVYPVMLNTDGSAQDNEREAVTPLALLRRHLLRKPPQRTDWVSAAFWLLPARVYRSLGGFDERYFMYCEDTDFCLRMRLAGLALQRSDAVVVHAAGRGSRRSLRHLSWHLRSLWRLWTNPVLRRYLASAGA